MIVARGHFNGLTQSFLGMNENIKNLFCRQAKNYYYKNHQQIGSCFHPFQQWCLEDMADRPGVIQDQWQNAMLRVW